jgi:PBP1b-binding outer membrane lipoprotein LpoB
MKRSTLFGVAVLLIAAALLFAGCTDTGETPSASAITTGAPTAAVTQPVQPAQSAQLQDPNAQFESLIAESKDAFNLTIPKLKVDMVKNDLAALQRDSATISSQAGSYYTRIQALKVSPEYKDVQSNYLKFLDDLRTANDFYVKGSSALQSGDLENGNKYVEQGNAFYLNAVEDLKAMT